MGLYPYWHWLCPLRSPLLMWPLLIAQPPNFMQPCEIKMSASYGCCHTSSIPSKSWAGGLAQPWCPTDLDTGYLMHFINAHWFGQWRRQVTGSIIQDSAGSGSDNRIHLPLSLLELCALYICKTVLPCHLKADNYLSLLSVSLLYLKEPRTRSYKKIPA